MHDLPLITTIAAALTSAWIFGILTQRFGLSPIVGYLLGGILIGPHTPGFVGDVGLAQQLAEVGVILLMFGVGLHFHIKDLLAVKAVAIPGAIGQTAIATLFGIWIFTAFGISKEGSAVIGMALAVASTVVLMRVLLDANLLDSRAGHVAVGWLLVEDVITVVILVLIPVVGMQVGNDTNGNFWLFLGTAIFKLIALVALVMLIGSRIIPWALVQVTRLRSRELFTLTVLVFSIAIAAGSYYFFGASMALGAFLAGMVVGQSPVSHQAASDALPMRDAFSVLFFVSVGMLFDPAFIFQEPLMILAALMIVLLIKPLSALLLVLLLGHSPRVGLTVALGLAQVGEFSFILSELARHHGLMPSAGSNTLIAAAILSISVNPILFRCLIPIEAWLRSKPKIWSLLNRRAESHAQKLNQNSISDLKENLKSNVPYAIVVGFGPVGRAVTHLLNKAKIKTTVIEMNLDTVAMINDEHGSGSAIYGDAGSSILLEEVGIKSARYLLLTMPHASSKAAIVMTAKQLNPEIRILVRTHYLGERKELEMAGAAAVVYEETEVAVALSRIVLADTGASEAIMDREIHELIARLSKAEQKL